MRLDATQLAGCVCSPEGLQLAVRKSVSEMERTRLQLSVLGQFRYADNW